uniref:Uncharacterized protein n=1 Tax=viral metagenome TaxID=1070528 RepID=A0A6C0DWK1_9ZZZZ
MILLVNYYITSINKTNYSIFTQHFECKFFNLYIF